MEVKSLICILCTLSTAASFPHNDTMLGDHGDVAESLQPTLTYEVFPTTEEIITNTTRCSHTQVN